MYNWTKDGMNVPMRGKTGTGDGVHVLTGPIYVCGAEPGDVLQIDILDLQPRVNPSTGKTFGSNAAAWCESLLSAADPLLSLRRHSRWPPPLQRSRRSPPATVPCVLPSHAGGYQFRAGFLDGDKREVITIYEATTGAH